MGDLGGDLGAWLEAARAWAERQGWISLVLDALRERAVQAAIAGLFALLGIIWAVFRRRAVRSAKGDLFSVLICDLEDDKGEREKKRIGRALADQFPGAVEVISLPRRFELGHDQRSAKRARAEQEAQTWLRRKKADLLIWGEVLGAEKAMRLSFLPRAGAGEGRSADYALTPTLTLPLDFGDDLSTALGGVAAGAAAPAVDNAGRYLVDVLQPVVARLGPLVERPPPGLGGEGRAQIACAYALAAATIGEQAGDSAALEAAVRAYEAALQEWTRDKVPLDWAGTQNNLGAALRSLGAREAGTARLEAAVRAYEAALQEMTRDKVPLDWAMTQNNLGNALANLGEREAGTARLEAAVRAYEAALQVFREAGASQYVAQAEKGLARVRATLAERSSGGR